MIITSGLVNAKVRSDKLYGFIVKYFDTVSLDERTRSNLSPNIPIFFFYSLAKAYPSLDDNADFFAKVNSYLNEKIDELTDQQCETCFDIWKLNENFINEETKAALVERRLILKET